MCMCVWAKLLDLKINEFISSLALRSGFGDRVHVLTSCE